MSARLPVRHVFRAAAATYRAQSWRVLGIALLLLIPAELLTELGDWIEGQMTRPTLERVIVFALVSIGGSLASSLGAAFYIGLVDHTVHAVRHGADPEPVTTIATKLPYWRMVGVAVLAGLLVAVGFVALVVPGLVLMTLLGIAAPVVVLERTGVVAALRRSAGLVRPQFWRVALAVTVPVIAEGAVVDAVADAVGHGRLAELAVHGILGTIVYAYVLLLEVHTAHWLIDEDRVRRS